MTAVNNDCRQQRNLMKIVDITVAIFTIVAAATRCCYLSSFMTIAIDLRQHHQQRQLMIIVVIENLKNQWMTSVKLHHCGHILREKLLF